MPDYRPLVDWIRAYSEPFPDRDSAIGDYEFPIDAYLGRIAEYVIAGADGVPALESKPAILLEGMSDKGIDPHRAIAGFRSVWPDAPVVELAGVGHFCQEDAPQLLVSNIRQFLQTKSLADAPRMSALEAQRSLSLTISDWRRRRRLRRCRWGVGRVILFLGRSALSFSGLSAMPLLGHRAAERQRRVLR